MTSHDFGETNKKQENIEISNVLFLSRSSFKGTKAKVDYVDLRTLLPALKRFLVNKQNVMVGERNRTMLDLPTPPTQDAGSSPPG